MKYPSYPRYKPSRVEWLCGVPEHWDVQRGRFLMRVNATSERTRSLQPEQEVSFVPMEAVGVNGGLDLSKSRTVCDAVTGYTEFQDGDVIVAKITPCFENGKGALAQGLLNGAAYGTTELHVLRPGLLLNRKFLFYLTLTDLYRKLGASQMYGAGGQKRVPPEFNKDFRVPLPPLREQELIVDFLDQETRQLDLLVAKKRELIDKLKEKRASLISRTVTRGLPPDAARDVGLSPSPPLKPSGIAWLGDIPAHWNTPPLYVRYSVELGKMLNESRITGDHLIPYLRNVDVQWDCINFDDLPEMDVLPSEYRRYTISEGDLLVCEGGEVGRAAVVGTVADVIGYQKALHRIRALTPEEHPRFLFYTLYWAAKTGVFNVGGISTIAHLTGEQLRRYRFPRPPATEQRAISEYLDRETGKIRDLIEKIEAIVNRLQGYRTALITAAVTGKIDVRGLNTAKVAQADEFIPFSKTARISSSS